MLYLFSRIKGKCHLKLPQETTQHRRVIETLHNIYFIGIYILIHRTIVEIVL